MAGIELYAPRKPRHRRTWSLAAVVLAVVFLALGQVMAVVPLMAAGTINPDASLKGSTLR